MPRIDRYILSQMLTLFGFFALVLVSVYWINRAVSLFEQLMSDGQTALVVLEFTALTLPVVISVVLPVAAFAATAYGTNRLSNESELVAMQTAGLSPWRLARPVLVFGLVVSVMVGILVNGLVPAARARMADRQAEIAENVTAQFLRPGVFQYPVEGITVFIGSIASDGRLLDVFLEDARLANRRVAYTAEEALVVRGEAGPVLIMLKGMIQTLHGRDETQRLDVTRFEELSYDIGAMVSKSSARGRDLRDYATLRLLNPDAELLAATGATPERARVEAHERIAQPLLSPVAAMIGFATLLIGGYSRFGVWRQVLWAIVGLIGVQFLTIGAANLAGADPSRWPLIYVPAVAGTGLCLLLLWMAGRRRRPCPPAFIAGGSGKTAP
ncbi:LPS export ABC transporter permease LptF [Paracoccus zhejiangensis]|uniref:LPS export ABC transporter permease LptF n=1 Tax=Paracoccus zhejiangensis TaxID=1077935 RepID=A0A2H5EUM5_9RHOB|nr:LPS export ABC transporter permease LptF [Paracoccus zhejiangensis]AUH63005.1 LPS export ABC transporter permease LptF [Paracoccus zhejiangensis]